MIVEPRSDVRTDRVNCSRCRRFTKTVSRSPLCFRSSFCYDTVEWVVAIIRDVTERYREEKNLRARLTDLEKQRQS